MRGSQASPRITIQQLWNTLNREKDSWARLPEGRVQFHPSNSVAEPLTTQRCSGLSLAQLRHCVTIPPPPTWSSCPRRSYASASALDSCWDPESEWRYDC